MKKSPTDASLNSNGSVQPRQDTPQAGLDAAVKVKSKFVNLVKNKSSKNKQNDHKDLSDVHSLHDAFLRFGYTAEDNVRIHDRVKIYQQVSRDMRAKLTMLRHKRYHLAAKRLQLILDSIKNEYDIFYRKDEKKRQLSELHKLNNAMHVIRQKYDQSAEELRAATVREKEEKHHELESLQEAQIIKLEHHISRLPKPRKRASTKMLAMIQGKEREREPQRERASKRERETDF